MDGADVMDWEGPPPCGHNNNTHPTPCWWIDQQEAITAAIKAERARLSALVEELPQGNRTSRYRYTDEEGNTRTDYERPARVTNDGRVALAAVLALLDEP